MQTGTMANLRWLNFGLILLAVVLQVELWLSDDGFRKTRELRSAVADQQLENESLRKRNALLDAEIRDLKQGTEAAEERARNDLGMIGRTETFYQVVTNQQPR